MFVDRAKIFIKSGKGGDGAVTFRREPFVPEGGPDGGDGGRGGDVIFQADRNLRTLMDFKYKKKYEAENGQNGMKKKRFGKAGENLIIKVPMGTVVIDEETGLVMKDLVEDGVLIVHDRFVDAAVGKRLGRDVLPVPALDQRVHPVLAAKGEELGFQIVIIGEAVVPARGIQDPVADIDHVQQTPELLLCEFDLHHASLPSFLLYTRRQGFSTVKITVLWEIILVFSGVLTYNRV